MAARDVAASVRSLRLAQRVLSEDARRIETQLAKVLGVETGRVREYVISVLEERLWRGGGKSERRTGFRMVRGTHGCSYVRDPEGMDVLPRDMEPPPDLAVA